MDFVGMMHLAQIKQEALLRESEQDRRRLRTVQFHRLPKLARVLILAFS
jgi:hypothetical protein